MVLRERALVADLPDANTVALKQQAVPRTHAQDQDRLADSVRRNVDDRQEFFNQAMARALKPIDSHANFVMMNTLHPAEEVIDPFRTNNILIRRPFPLMNTYIRISLGLPEEMSTFWQTWDRLPYAKNLMHHH